MLIHGFEVPRGELTDEQRENNRRWVEALRSGKYTQAKEHLRTCDGMCCLGVAEDITGVTWDRVGDEWVAKRSDEDTEDESSTQVAKALFGFDQLEDGFIVGGEAGAVWHLSGLNDYAGATFQQIADIVAYWAGLEEVTA